MESKKAFDSSNLLFYQSTEELKPEIRKLRKSKKFRLTKQELKWLVEQDGYDYLKEFSKNDIVTFGRSSYRER